MKNLIILTILAVLLGGAAWYISTNEEKSIEQAAPSVCEVLGGAVTSGTLTRLQIAQPDGKKIDLNLVDGVWYADSARKHKADAAAVERLVAELEKNVKGEIVSTEEATLKDYQLTETSATKVTLHTKNRPEECWLIGKAGTSYTTSYVRKAGSNNVINAEFNYSNFFVNPQGWRDRTILKVAKDNIKELRAEGTSATYVLKRDRDKWVLDGTTSEPSSAKVDEVINALTTLRASDFVDDVSTESLKKLQLDVPPQKLTVVMEDKSAASPNEETHVLYFGSHDKLRNLTHVKLQDAEDVYVIGEYAAKKMLPTLGEIAPPPPPKSNDALTTKTK